MGVTLSVPNDVVNNTHIGFDSHLSPTLFNKKVLCYKTRIQVFSSKIPSTYQDTSNESLSAGILHTFDCLCTTSI